MAEHILDVLRAMSTQQTIILEGATVDGQIGQPAGIPVKIDRHETGGFVVWLHNGQSAYYNLT